VNWNGIFENKKFDTNVERQKEGDEVMGLGLWVISRGENDAD